MENVIFQALISNDWARAKEIVKKEREIGKTIGFTNGCFDILHVGHVTYLQAARETCDFLIMGVNSDASVKRLKGAGRPINDLAARMGVLAGLRSLDLIVSFGDDVADNDTPLKLITTLLPDVLLKGGDYTRDSIVGADVVEKNGGKVIVIPFVDGYSTTQTITKLKG